MNLKKFPLTDFFNTPDTFAENGKPGDLIRSENFDGYTVPRGVRATRILYGLINLPIEIYGINYTHIDFEITSFIGFPLAHFLGIFISDNSIIFSVHAFFYLSHLLCVLTIAIILTFTKFFHLIAGLGNIVLTDVHKQKGQLTFSSDGITKIEDFTFYQLLEADRLL